MRQRSQPDTRSPSQIPKTAPSRSASSAARPGGSEIGPTAVVPPRSWLRETVSSAETTAKNAVQATAVFATKSTWATPATGTPATLATRYCSPSLVPGAHLQPRTAL